MRSALETPRLDAPSTRAWASDHIAEMLRDLGVRFVALNPGSSLRGLHDSLVNHLGNEDPQLVLCLHEEHAVAIAHGYAKVTGRPMAVALHSNVGLMHASMAIYNAWCDRVPMLVLGATGPVDAARRRPWIDWIHTARDQGALVRPFVKWDDQPASLAAAAESLARAASLTRAEPAAPVYVCLDVGLQEAPVPADAPVPRVADYVAYQAPGAPPAAVDGIADALRAARRPVLLIGRASRGEAAWDARVRLAERLGAQVITDLRVGAAFPTRHPLHAAPPMRFMEPVAAGLLREADVILSLEWVDLGGTLQAAGVTPPTRVFHASIDHHVHNGWSMDHLALPRAELHVAAGADALVEALLAALGAAPDAAPAVPPTPRDAVPEPAPAGGPIAPEALGAAVMRATRGHAVCFTRLPLGWPARHYRFEHPLDYLGSDGGAGVGAGPGMAIGAALALQGTGRLAVAVLGDGDFLMSSNAWWTAAHYRLPLLVVVNNNRTYMNDVVHQERVARERGRSVANKWVAQQIADPDVDLCALARAQGAEAFGPVTDAAALDGTLAEALARAQAGAVVVVDVRVATDWDAGLGAALMPAGSDRP